MADHDAPRDQRTSRKPAAGIARRRLIGGGISALAAAIAVPRQAEAQLLNRRPPGAPALPARPIEIAARQIAAFDRTSTAKRQHGQLEFRGGLVLTAPAKEFGGWSGLVMSDDGRRLLAVSDMGSFMTAEVVYEDQRLRGLANAMLGDVPATGGLALARGRDKDAECVTLLDGTLAKGTVLIGFERNHRIGRYPIGERGLGAPMGFLKLPPDARRMSLNKGFEALAVLRGGPLKGSILAFAEELYDAERHHTGWIWPGGIGGEPQRLGMSNIADFAITDAAALPDGSVIVLERKFRWLEGVRMRLRLVRAAAIKPGAMLEGEVLLEADMSSEIDNMEGLAVSRDARGQTMLTIISDDNFNTILQRTILLQFALMDGTARAGRT